MKKKKTPKALEQIIFLTSYLICLVFIPIFVLYNLIRITLNEQIKEIQIGLIILTIIVALSLIKIHKWNNELIIEIQQRRKQNDRQKNVGTKENINKK